MKTVPALKCGCDWAMQCGCDWPFSMCHDLIQAAGRGGRKLETGLRRRVVFYLLCNRSDISEAVPGMSREVREFCLTDDCLKMYLRKIFGSSGSSKNSGSDTNWCCSNCS